MADAATTPITSEAPPSINTSTPASSDQNNTSTPASSGPTMWPIYVILFLLFASIVFNFLVTFKIVNLTPNKENFINNNENDYRLQEYYRHLYNEYIQ